MNTILKTLAALTVLSAGSDYAAGPTNDDTAKAQYEAERARCLSGTTGQDQASCLKSAGAAYDSIRQNRLNDPSTAFRDNALARCKTLPPADRADCESRVDGEGSSSGSVKNGGIIKETVTTTGAPTTTVPASK